jgi:hypothetical protein
VIKKRIDRDMVKNARADGPPVVRQRSSNVPWKYAMSKMKRPADDL